jgi:hypothetical protein
MTYKTAKAGQVVYYERKHWEPREEVVFVRYYKFSKDLLHPNMAVVISNNLQMNVDIKDLYRKAE